MNQTTHDQTPMTLKQILPLCGSAERSLIHLDIRTENGYADLTLQRGMIEELFSERIMNSRVSKISTNENGDLVLIIRADEPPVSI